jgi:hypothetical protein
MYIGKNHLHKKYKQQNTNKTKEKKIPTPWIYRKSQASCLSRALSHAPMTHAWCPSVECTSHESLQKQLPKIIARDTFCRLD